MKDCKSNVPPKLFFLEDGSEVLVTTFYEEKGDGNPFKMKSQTMINGESTAVVAGYDMEHVRDQMFREYTSEQAKEFRNKFIDYLNNASNGEQGKGNE